MYPANTIGYIVPYCNKFLIFLHKHKNKENILNLTVYYLDKYNSVLFTPSLMSDSLRHHGLQHTRLPCPSSFPWAWVNSCLLNWWCYSIISSSVILFSSCLQSFLAAESFPVNWLFPSDGQSIGASASASVLSMNIQGCFPLGLTSLISLLSRNSQGSSPTLPFKSSKSQWLYFILITSFKPLPQNTVAFWGTEGFFECEVYTSAK